MCNSHLRVKHTPSWFSLSRDAIALATFSALLVQFTDLSGSLDTDNVTWMIILWLTGINPSTISRVWLVIQTLLLSHPIPKASRNLHRRDSPTTKPLLSDQAVMMTMSSKNRRFICHELIHTITGFYHYFPFDGLVWIAIVNFPLWFAHLDLCMREKEQMQQFSSSSPYKNDPSTVGSAAGRFDRQSCQVQVQRDPLVAFSLIVYSIGVLFRGQSFLLSGAGVVIMSLPFLRRKADFSVAATVPPLVVLFGLEHYTIMNGMDTWHNVVHSLSHVALHVTVNNLFKHHVQ